MRMVRFSWLWLATIAVLAGCSPVATPNAEADWAKGIAGDFWKAFLNGEEEHAAALLSPELSTALTTGPNADNPWRILQPTPKGRLYQMAVRDHLGSGMTATTDTATVAPDRSEVVLKGRLTGKNEVGRETTFDFTMRVGRENGGGKWGVRYLLIAERRDQKKP